jgi:type II secretory pathway component GspD/PulD (secretin)
MNLSAVLNVANSDSNVKVVDAPSIVTTHAQRGLISVGEKVPIIESTVTAVTTPPSTTNSISSESITVQLTITPFIGTDGSVYMSIDQQVNDILGNVQINGSAQPIIGTRELTANVTVQDGGILVLGGLRERRETGTHGIVFLLGEIPIFGQLFQPDEHEVTTTELIVFIQPHIIKDTANEQYLARQVSGNSEAQDTSMKYIRTQSIEDSQLDRPGNTLPYSRDPSENTVIHPENYPPALPSTPPPAAGIAPPSASSTPPATSGPTMSAETAPISPNSENSSAAPQPIDTSGGFHK